MRYDYHYAMRLPQNGLVPAPFPGKYPTRIVVRWRRNPGDAPKDYCGKPTPLWRRFAERWGFNGRNNESFEMVEFDRKHMVRYWNSSPDTRRQIGRYGSYWRHATFVAFYYPTVEGGNPQAWTMGNIRTKVIERVTKELVGGIVKLTEKKHTVYALDGRMAAIEVRRHTDWLSAKGW